MFAVLADLPQLVGNLLQKLGVRHCHAEVEVDWRHDAALELELPKLRIWGLGFRVQFRV